MAINNIKTDRIFSGTAKRSGDFEFNEEIARVFDEEASRFIPNANI